ncbi:MAG TPA: hypothetical protein VD969_20355 [Symbiobacteriaceae bacterium]|nr:hypothetical protein [Symbiobacteriaceae bacterium]
MHTLTAARRCPRPQPATCAECGRPAGENYSTCSGCRRTIDRIWDADWDALLAAEGIAAGSEDERLLAAVVFQEYDKHPWTVLDKALTFLRCGSCGSELGGGPADCQECQMAFGHTLMAEWEALQIGLVTRNEHAIHIGRWILRHPHRFSAKVADGIRFSMPLLITGAEPPTAKTGQAAYALYFEGKEAEAERLWEAERERGGGRKAPWFELKEDE